MKISITDEIEMEQLPIIINRVKLLKLKQSHWKDVIEM